MSQVALECQCGAMRGVASPVGPRHGMRVICYCDDCQAYARHLGAERVLDSLGGTDIFQMAPAQLSLSQGVEELRCLRLSGGGLLRWYAACCRTPVGNTLARPWPAFVGVPSAFMVHSDEANASERALGPVQAKLNARFARGEAPADAHPKAPAGLILRTMYRIVRDSLKGKQRPTPFFSSSGEPSVAPTVLTPEERAAAAP